jgi:hypothetical protein
VILLELIVVDKFIYALIVSCHIIYRELLILLASCRYSNLTTKKG